MKDSRRVGLTKALIRFGTFAIFENNLALNETVFRFTVQKLLEAKRDKAGISRAQICFQPYYLVGGLEIFFRSKGTPCFKLLYTHNYIYSYWYISVFSCSY